MKHTWKFCNVSPSKRLKSRDFLISLRDSDCALHLVFLSFITGHSFSKAYHSCRRFVLIFHRFSPHSIMYVCFVCIDYSIGGNTGLFLFYLSNHPTLYTNLSLFCLFVYFLLHNLHCKHWFFFVWKKKLISCLLCATLPACWHFAGRFAYSFSWYFQLAQWFEIFGPLPLTFQHIQKHTFVIDWCACSLIRNECSLAGHECSFLRFTIFGGNFRWIISWGL